MGFWVLSEDSKDLICATRFCVRPNGKGHYLGCYDGNSGVVKLADYESEKEAVWQLDHIQKLMKRKYPDVFVYNLSEEKIKMPK